MELTSGCSSFAKTLRLMAGHELATEGFAKGQTGSSAMPHKMNARSCERVNGFHVILKGFLMMISGLAGDQWNEGDVSCSVVRRVVMPDSFYAADGLFETFLTVLNQMGVYEAVVAAELRRYLPFLMTTTILMEAVKRGIGRETAHEVIKEHAVAVSNDLRAGKSWKTTCWTAWRKTAAWALAGRTSRPSLTPTPPPRAWRTPRWRRSAPWCRS